ncbi:DUF2513 domain-containing protein [Pleomorphomonas koreensis]|uniref:DUF2513 domain-containing protein n=1 Tax=Pleomorphomonas koreensis TaxID=257440 RepID=UPI00041383AA|nr:DUF2513 domain-containing protein [Pleomorphomonas koreensis]
MIRDMELIRALLLKLEAIPKHPASNMTIDPNDKEVAVPGYEVEQIAYHLELIDEAGFIDNANIHPSYGIGFRKLTWDGHDFLDSIRDPDVWNKTKQGAAAAGGFTLDLLKDLAKGFLRKQIEERTGITL